MSCSKEESRNDDKSSLFVFLPWNNANKNGEKCICSIDRDDMFPYVGDCRYRGEVAVHTGFANMGVCTKKQRTLINQWTNELGKAYCDWLSHDNWYTYLYYKFMAWRIVQMKYLKKSCEDEE